MSKSQEVDAMSSKKRALLELLLKERDEKLNRTRRITRRERTGPLPVSFGQQQLWFLDQLEPNNYHYNIPGAMRFKGRLNVRVLEQSVTEIVRRHEALRTTFTTVNATPVQVVSPAPRITFPIVDLCGLPEPEREAEVLRLSGEEARRPFDLSQDLLLRGTILRLAPDDHLLLLNQHHIGTDGWSIDIFYRELAALYDAFKQGQPSPLHDLPIQYADYSVWQREYLQGETLEKLLGYWKTQLAGAPALLELPTDRPRPAAQGIRGAAQNFVVSADEAQKLRDLSQREGATLFMTMLAAFKALLYRYARQTDILVGMPMANRTRPEVEDLIGFFINTVVVRTRLSGEETFREMLRQVRDNCLGAIAHQELPIDRLIEELQLNRDLSYNPLFQVFFNLLFSKPATTFSDLELSLPDVDYTASKFDMALELVDTGQEILGWWVYNTDLFEAATISRLVGHFRVMLAGLATDPDTPVRELPLLTDDERQLLLGDWAGAPAAAIASSSPSDTLLWHELFERQAARTPDAHALSCGPVSYTYSELDAAASALATRLRAIGAGPDSLVALLSERDASLWVWALAVHKAGAGFLPLDPRWPAARLSRVLSDSGAVAVISSPELAAAARDALTAAGSTARLLVPSQDSAELPESSGLEWSSVPLRPSPDSLAYVIYTSGSTGLPKGAMLSHRGLLNHLLAKLDDLQLSPSDIVAQTAPQSFDISIWQAFAPLLCGAHTLVFPDDVAHDPSRLLPAFDSSRVSIAELVPGVLSAALDQLSQADGSAPHLASLRWMLLTGEALPPELCRRWLSLYPAASVLNAYGPTECSDDVTHAPVTTPPPAEARRVPIGRAVRSTRLYVTEPGGDLAPLGVAGELFVGGAGVGRGYLGRPALTAERFVPDPHSGEAGARLYRTGDLVRRLTGGELDYLGRLDTQVKVRGFRIELGEVESVLSAHEAIGEAAVEVRGDASGLVAYVVGRGGAAPPPPSELRAWLAERLPDYMVPSGFVALDALPLTSNGKLDRKALPEPAAGGGETGRAPRTPSEELVAGIWREVLAVERVGAEENFFELGGHSLLATQVMTRLRRAFGVELPLRTLFETPTVEGLARAAEAARARASSSGASAAAGSAPALRAIAGRGAESPLSFAQQRLWFLEQLEPGGSFYHVSGAVRLRGSLDHAALDAALAEVVRRHEALRTGFVSRGGEPVQVVSDEARAGVEYRDLTALGAEGAAREAARLSTEQSERSFELERAPLLRLSLFKVASEEYVLAVTLHHLITDGWSMALFVGELSECYAASREGRTPALADPGVQYADYAIWQRSWLRGEALDAQLSYWREQLAGAPARLELPTDRPRPPVQSFRGAVERVRLSAGLCAKLGALGRRQGATPFMVLLAGFQALLARYSGQEEVVVGTPVANRHRPGTEGVMGLLANTLALRCRLEGDPSVGELLGRVREAALGAYEHQDLPFERLVEELQPERDLSHNPIFQTLFALQQGGRGGWGVPEGWEWERVEAESGTSKFDLSLWLRETEGGGFEGEFEYNTDLFEVETARRMLRHYERLLEGMAEGEGGRVSSLALLGAEERAWAVSEHNSRREERGEERGEGLLVHQLFERQARARPDSPAVEAVGERVSYRELEARAEAVAGRLRELGVGPEVRVGISVGRGVGMWTAVLGVLKAGGAYVPLDPVYPEERLRYMLEDSGARVLLSERGVGAWAEVGAGGEGGGGVQTVYLDEGASEATPSLSSSSSSPASSSSSSSSSMPSSSSAEVRPENLAYVIYTSGSTGRPKGVCVTHAAAVNFLLSMLRRPGLEPDDRLLAVTTLSFDIALLELLLPLAAGASVEAASREEAADARLLSARLAGVTAMQATPATWRMLFDSGWEGSPHLKALCGGEALSPDLARELGARTGEAWNMYGPTETTVWSSLWRVEPEAGRVTVGGPIADTSLYVVEAGGDLAPAGVAGELLIGGAGLARGYLGRPALTAERFVPDPHSGERGARLYRTGDLARRLTRGEVECLGRVDNQVKVRGFRIELGEVEAALQAEEGVAEAAVSVTGAGGVEARLVAYVVAKAGERVTAGGLRGRLRQRLPDYMMPAAFVMLDALPRTPNGKLERKALPRPEAATTEGGGGEPRTPVEEVVAGVWAEVLGAERVGAEENFFELGGHSLLATRVAARVGEALGVELPLRTLFEAPTVAGMSAEVEKARRGELSYPSIRRSLNGATAPLSFAQQRLWAQERARPGDFANNVAVLLRQSGPLDLSALERALNEIIRRHEVLRTTYAEVAGEPAQHVQAAAALALSLKDFSDLPPAESEAKAREEARAEARRPFDLSQAPLLRARVLRLGSEEHLILLLMHHVVIDPWSLGVMLRELSSLYAAYTRGEPSTLPELQLQYADYARWERAWLGSEALEKLLGYWREQLRGPLPILDVPASGARTGRGSRASKECPLAIEKVVFDRLRALGREESATLYMTLLTAYAVLLHGLTGEEDVVVTSPMANRIGLELEPLVGFFANTVALRTSLAGEPTFRELLRRVRRVAFDAYAHQAMPFEVLLEELNGDAAEALGRVSFSMLSLPPGPSAVEGGPLYQPEEVGLSVVDVDLSLRLWETPEGRLAGRLVYDAGLFEDGEVARIAEQFSDLLRHAAAEPDLPVSSLRRAITQE
jgi:amino acid adenylation domain-containing protein